MSQTYTPRHVGREKYTETGEYSLPFHVPRHRRIMPARPVAESPDPTPTWR